jgi:hypothetical protein
MSMAQQLPQTQLRNSNNFVSKKNCTTTKRFVCLSMLCPFFVLSSLLLFFPQKQKSGPETNHVLDNGDEFCVALF